MKILVVGGTGATGKLVIEQLLDRDFNVRAVVRDTLRIPEQVRDHPNLELLEASLLRLNTKELETTIDGCVAIISCLGHNISFKGLFGPPYRLVKRAVQRLTTVVEQQNTSAKFILMNTVGVANPDIREQRSFSESLVTGILRLLLPPFADNVQAAKYLRVKVGQDHPHIQWVTVRPDSLLDEQQVTDYTLHPSPTRSAIFDPGQTSRINVAHFIADLIEKEELWNQWKGQMPVIYNSE